MNTAVYIRWSTEDQGSGTTLDVQRDSCLKYSADKVFGAVGRSITTVMPVVLAPLLVLLLAGTSLPPSRPDMSLVYAVVAEGLFQRRDLLGVCRFVEVALGLVLTIHLIG